LAALTAGKSSAWTLSGTNTGATFCSENVSIKMWDHTTASRAIVRFKWTATRVRTLPDSNYDDFSYSFSTYNTQMYMGYNDMSGVTGENLVFWEGIDSSSTTPVDFDTWNKAKNVLTVDGALSGLFSVSASIVAAAGLALSF